jgi:hypothetical protein
LRLIPAEHPQGSPQGRVARTCPKGSAAQTAAHRGKTPFPPRWGRSPRASRGPQTQAASHEDTSRTRRRARPRACPPRSHDKLSLHPSINTPAAGRPAAVSPRSSPNAAARAAQWPANAPHDEAGWWR